MYNIETILKHVSAAMAAVPDNIDDRHYHRVYADLADVQRELAFLVKREAEEADGTKHNEEQRR